MVAPGPTPFPVERGSPPSLLSIMSVKARLTKLDRAEAVNHKKAMRHTISCADLIDTFCTSTQNRKNDLHGTSENTLGFDLKLCVRWVPMHCKPDAAHDHMCEFNRYLLHWHTKRQKLSARHCVVKMLVGVIRSCVCDGHLCAASYLLHWHTKPQKLSARHCVVNMLVGVI